MLNIQDRQPILALTYFTDEISPEQIAGIKTVIDDADATVSELIRPSGDAPILAIYAGDELTVDGSKCDAVSGIGTVTVYFTASNYVAFGQNTETAKKTFPRALIHHVEIAPYEP